MSKALRCDRCKGYYRPDEEVLETSYIPRIGWRNAESVRNQQITKSMEDIDLCADCTKDFERFLKGWPLNVEEKESRCSPEVD